MKIESIIQRPNGTKVELDGTVYHFKPEASKGPHVANVADEGHAELLLNIPEGYRMAVKAAKQTKPEESNSSNGSQVLQGDDVAGEADGSAGSSANPRDEADKAVAELLTGSIAKIKLAMPSLTVDQIDTAIAFEGAAEQPRTSLLAALEDEKTKRAAQ